MRRFVLCRNDKTWGLKATHNLIELFLNPGGDLIGGEALESTTSKTGADWNQDSELLGIITADQLLKVLIFVSHIRKLVSLKT